ncbi:Glycerol-3-phosphate acyltransferase 1, mitochondrial [Frankliniella fusca]|uniref:Glycerol-3-phosphate acyltransferase 1, mitochondrial n=1 Tax=Frankliniella fusca TaxID=407009 RepID=A0AAE1HVF0_9NEOP|nr:Glycerol-3-phosphate acyltransferase 1, mitochondrial [Frankliniella fusca]
MTGIELILLLVVLGFLWNSSSGRAMVDVLSARVQDMYSGWGPRGPVGAHVASAGNTLATPTLPLGTASGAEADALTGIAMRRMASYQRQQRRQDNQRVTKQISDRRLFQLKDTHWDVLSDNSKRPLMGLACNACSGPSRVGAAELESKSVGLRNILQEEFAPNSGYASRLFKHLAQVYNLRKFDYPTINESVLKDERLKEAIEHTAKDQCNQRGETSQDALNKLIHQHELRAKRLLDDMRSKLSDLLLRFTSWVMLKVLPCFLTSVVVHPSQVEMLQKAGRSGLPLIFLPLHRSHLDYILVTFILLNIDVKSPMVAAGDNLKIPVFGGLLRGLGAFFIKRRMDPVAGRRDTVYRAVLHTYMMHSLRAGHNLEFFAEGGRTRTGKACMPKGGLLSVIVDAYMDGTVEDALLVPVSLNYEKLVDGNFTREQMGQPKQMESFTSAIRGIWKTLTSNYGSCRIDFNQPFSLQDMIRSFQQSQISHLRRNVLGEEDEEELQKSKRNEKRVLQSTPSSSSLYGTDVVVEEHRQLVESIAKHVIHDCTKSTAVMTTNIVSFLLLSSFRNGACIEEIANALDLLRRELEWSGRDCGFTGDSVDVINYAAELLGSNLVKKEKQVVNGQEKTIVKPITTLPNVIELAYYSNGLLSHFAIESALATAIVSLIECDPTIPPHVEQRKLTHQEIVERTKEVCDVLQLEFIFAKACQNLDSLISDAIHGMIENDILSSEQEMLTEEQEWSNRYAKTMEDSDEDFDESPGPSYEVNIKSKESMKRLMGRECLVRPLIDTYIVTAMSLRFLVDQEVTERDLMKKILSEVQAQLDQGFITYAESVSTDSIKNALKLFERWGVVECHTQDRVKLYYLSPDFDKIDSILEVVNHIGQYKLNFQIEDGLKPTP